MKPVTRLALILLAIGLLPIGTARAEGASPSEDSWFAIYLSGAKSGWMHTVTTVAGAGESRRTTTRTDLSVSFMRAGQKATIVTGEETEEDPAGRVLRFSVSRSLGFGASKITGTLQEDGTLAVDEGGRPRVVAYPKGALGPAAARRRLLETAKKEEKQSHHPVFVLDFLGQAVDAHYVARDREKVDVHGLPRLLQRIEETLSALPGVVSVHWFDDRGREVVMAVDVPGLGAMRMVRTAKEIALRPGEPAEVFLTTMVVPDRAIPRPRLQKQVTYRLSLKKGRVGDIPSGVGQSVTRREDGSVTVSVDTRPPEGVKGYELPCTRKDMAPLLEPTAFLECDDPTVVRFAREAVGDETDPVAAAKAIESFVRKRVKTKSLGVAFASAAEVARHLEGDCTEHAVLCAAMARARRMPSRIVMGLVYLPPGGMLKSEVGVFAYHMWTEVLIGDATWLAIDAAMGGMDATHIVLARSRLETSAPLLDLAIPLLKIMGNLSVQVLETR